MQITRRDFLYLAGVVSGLSAVKGYGEITKKLSRIENRYSAVILRGDFPDPSILRDGKDYYMTHSSDDIYTPSLLIWHSTDLFHWSPLCQALRNFPYVIAAPEFIKYGDLFYIYYPSMGTIYVITARHPEGPWSKPVDLKVPGFDPGHAVGLDNKRYLYFSGGRIIQLANDGLSVQGEMSQVYDGWNFPEDWNVECYCLESPKITFHSGYYYMTSAEGGTTGPSTSHMAVSARSRSPFGPWENSPHNPILHTRSANERWWSKGHGTLIEDGSNNWYIVYHAYENGHRELGRQTLIEPVEWTSEQWFKTFTDGRADFNPRIIRNYAVHSDKLLNSTLDLQWGFGGNKNTPDYDLGNECVRIFGSEKGIQDMHCRISDLNYEASFQLEGPSDAEYGAILLYKNGVNVYAGIGKKGNEIFSLRRGRPTSPITLTSEYKHFKIRVIDNDMKVYCSKDGVRWIAHPEGIDISGYDENVLGGYAGLKIAAYIKGKGTLSISDFNYQAINQ